MDKSTAFVSSPDISVCTLVSSQSLAEQVERTLKGDRYCCCNLNGQSEFLEIVETRKHQIDCLIFQETTELPDVVHELHLDATLLPTIIVEADAERVVVDHKSAAAYSNGQIIYHKAEVHLQPHELNHLSAAVSQAINQFMKLYTRSHIVDIDWADPEYGDKASSNPSFNFRDQTLSKKLYERLGYLGTIYKRNSTHFFRNLSQNAQQALLKELSAKYREIISIYFHEGSTVNQHIDMFVNMVFFADLPTAKIIEIHMELMDIYEKQLLIEGRNPDFLGSSIIPGVVTRYSAQGVRTSHSH